jgi:hypothetical protein
VQPLTEAELTQLQALMDGIPDTLEPLDVVMIDGYLCGVLLQPQPVPPERWLPLIPDVDGRAPPARFDLATMRALVLRRHAERVVAQLDAARQRVVRLAQTSGCRFVAPPQGLFGWVDTGVDTEPLAARLAAAGWLVAPGRLFLAAPRATTLMRVNFASAQDATFWHAFVAARQALAGTPVR